MTYVNSPSSKLSFEIKKSKKADHAVRNRAATRQNAMVCAEIGTRNEIKGQL
tara:strand:+ start:95 stop:250 length:156 start_codon:yes stop_codon:yes gene_type:complete